MQILNLTPHDVKLYDAKSETVVWTFFRTVSDVCRVATPPQTEAGTLETCALRAQESCCSGDFVPEGASRAYSLGGPQDPPCGLVPLVTPPDFAAGVVTGIPAWAHGLAESGYPYALIVGQIGAEAVAKAFKGTVFATDTGPGSAVRDAKGNILGVRRLILVQRGE